jgi:hypothetical protein
MNALNVIQTKLIAPKGQFNAFGKYKYRSCEDILESLKPLLKETESTLQIVDEIVSIGDRFYVKATATLKNKDGEWVGVAYAREETDIKGMAGSQITGASSSYARKYALNGLFCIDDTKDADSTNEHKITVYDEVMGKMKSKFKTIEEKKKWFDDRKIIKAVKEMTDSELSNLLDALNDIS